MPRTDREVVARLGAAGMARVLSDVLDQARLIRLANAVGLSYPGMRTQSQKRGRLVADLADKAGREEAAALAVVRTLRKETGALGKEWAGLSLDDRAGRLSDPQLGTMNGRLGPYLFVAASAAPELLVEESLGQLLSRMTGDENGAADDAAAPPGESPAKEAQRLRKKCAELQRKVRYLEGQITKTKDVEKSNKRDLLLRKGELAEARMLAERLRRDLDEVRGKHPEPPAGAPAPQAVGFEELDRSMKRLSTEQRRLTHRIESLADTKAAAPAPSLEAVEALGAALAEIQKDLGALRRERRKDLQDQAKRLDELAAGLAAARSALEASPKAARAHARKKGEPDRVGVFIDVQNMYYAARQLKGKLDFDALLQACVLDRRLIQATAYVVESKEIDQSGFIAMLQQRAIEVRRKTLKVRSDGSMKGDWDMEMALDILDMAPKLDVVVLVSGDGDFTSLVKRVKGIGPRVEVVAFPRNTAKSLLEAADRFHALDRRAMIRVEVPPEDVPTAEPVPAPKNAP
ncbi:MAG TPA: NYN domain-containing protein [Candidatus Polarisedimenticolaceae bacterium]|nr:NYN domain-containing protein [Candidatus Polarisedimenticolaceae bacterium]